MREKIPFNPEWIKYAKLGDESALTLLYNYSYQEVYLTVKSMLRQDEDAVLDIVQDAFLKAFSNLNQLEDPNRFHSWVKRIARNRALDVLRQSRTVLFSELSTGADGDQPFEAEDTDIYNLPEVTLDRQETARLIREILDGLPEGQRIVVSMHYYQGMKVSEIAAVLGRSENTIKVQLRNGRKAIEEKVRELERRDGVKLYSLSPIPFLLLLLRSLDVQPDAQVLQHLLSSAAAAQGAAAAGGASAAGGSTAAGGTSAAASAAGTVGQAVGTAAGKALAGKIIAGVLAAALLIGGGGVAVSQIAGNENSTTAAEEQTEEPSSEALDGTAAGTEETEPVSDDGEETADTTESYATPLEAYRHLLQEMESDPDTILQYSSLIDLNQDGVDEVAILYNSFYASVYTFQNGRAVLLCDIDLPYSTFKWGTDNSAGELPFTYRDYEHNPLEVLISLYESNDMSTEQIEHVVENERIWPVLSINQNHELIFDIASNHEGADIGFTFVSYQNGEIRVETIQGGVSEWDSEGNIISEHFAINGIPTEEIGLADVQERTYGAARPEDDTNYILGNASEQDIGNELLSFSTGYEEYDAILEDYYLVLSGQCPISETELDVISYPEGISLYHSPSAGIIDETGYYDEYAASSYSYACKDLNGDGIDELLIGYDNYNQLMDVWTISDQGTQPIISGYYRWAFEICENGVVVSYDFGGIYDHTYQYFHIDDLIQEIQEPFDTLILHTDGTYSRNGTSLSESEVNAIYPIMTDFDWQPLCDTVGT